MRVVNVVNLMTLQPPSEHPHGLSDWDFDALFTTDKPVIFAFHGYPCPTCIFRSTFDPTAANHGTSYLALTAGMTITPQLPKLPIITGLIMRPCSIPSRRMSAA